jgi:outer membrane receptor protein involved in Fe transport
MSTSTASRSGARRLPCGRQWNASLWVKNIFNEEGVTGTFTELYMGTAPADRLLRHGAKDLISLPRTIGLSFNYNF